MCVAGLDSEANKPRRSGAVGGGISMMLIHYGEPP